MNDDRCTSEQGVFDHLLGPAAVRLFEHSIRELDATHSLVGNEILMRGPAGTPYEMPTLAFAMAATLGSLERLDCNCIEAAMKVNLDGLLFLNVHPETVVHSARFWELIGKFGTDGIRPPSQAVFEVVEHSPARETDLPDALRELRALGFQIAIDDLGEGMSGLRRLVEVEPDFVKIDRFFIDGIDRSSRKRVVVEAIASLGRETGARIIGEGVETMEEARVLSDSGIEICQGYLFGRPQEISQ